MLANAWINKSVSLSDVIPDYIGKAKYKMCVGGIKMKEFVYLKEVTIGGGLRQTTQWYW